ncbi:MAG TPA: DNA-binding protein WhiA [Candidatus Limnocylindrales bacterium]|nr:DNA-binding protein WhiA [Candidatus Limnocylindrales bacterium]
MSGTDRDLVAALRAELAAVDPARPCDRQAEIAGLGPRPVTREGTVARLIVRLGGHAADGPAAGPQPGAASAPHAPGHAAHASHVRRTFVLPPAELDWATAAEHCRLAWLRGRFLARGSLSLSGGRAHLEFVVPAGEAADLAGRLADVGLPASWRLRRGLGVVTWKSTESIAQFLGRIGASASLLELEARNVARSLRGELNRVINAESANLQRSVEAAGRQLAAIDALEADGRLQAQPRTVRAVAEARRETPEASLSEIAARLDLHRSAVQRALDRLERLALHDDEGIGQRHPTAARAHAAARP